MRTYAADRLRSALAQRGLPDAFLEWFCSFPTGYEYRFRESLDAEQTRVQGDPEPDRVHRIIQVGRLVPERRILAHLFVRTARTRSLPSPTRFMESLQVSKTCKGTLNRRGDSPSPGLEGEGMD